MILQRSSYYWYLLPLLFLIGLFGSWFYKGIPVYSLLIGITGAILILYFFLFYKSLLFSIAILAIPLSVGISGFMSGSSLVFPSEIIAVGMALVFLAYGIFNPVYTKGILNHPITILMLLDTIWLVLTSFTSEMPIVSLKRVLIRVCFLIFFYLLTAHWMVNKKNLIKYLLLYSVGLIVPIIHTAIKHSRYNFDSRVVFDLCRPFYSDHTVFGAAIAFVIPFMIIFVWNRRIFNVKKSLHYMGMLVLGTLIVAEILAFSRASWISLVGALAIYIMLKLKLKFVVFLGGLLVLVFTGYYFQNEIYLKARENENVSNNGEITEHIMSVSNLNSDASNLERVNRWKSAIRLFYDRPMFGFGPGTYQFVYGPYQSPYEMTHISTIDGNKGNAHSELLTYLSETGLPGFISALVWMLATIGFGFRAYYKSKDKQVKLLVMAALLGFITFFIHGMVNSFIDQVKMAGLVFGTMAIIVVADLHSRTKSISGEEEKAAI